MTIKQCVEEYTRIMGGIDITPEFRARLTQPAAGAQTHAAFPVRTAVAATAITGTAIAVALGIRRHVRHRA